MNNFVILIPSYNDWDNLNVLIPKIHNILKNKDKSFSIIIINDASTIKNNLAFKSELCFKKIEILNLIKNNKPTRIGLNTVEFEFIDKKSNRLKILFDKNTLELKGWETKDAYSNSVSFLISNLKTNNQIVDSFFKIPKEEDL